jgi:PAS domain S-box-containing protein
MKNSNEQLMQGRVRDPRENTDFASTLFESLAGYAIIAADFDGNIIAYNNGARQIYGYTSEEIVGKQNIEIFFPEDFIKSGKLQQIIVDIKAKGQFSYEGEKVRKNGATFPAKVIFTLTKHKNSSVTGFVEMVEDLTRRKQAEEKLTKSEAQYRRLFETAKDGILILDGLTGRIVDVNPFLMHILEYDRKDFLGKYLWEIGPFKDVEAAKAAFKELQEKDYIRYEHLPLESKGGRRVEVEFVSNSYLVDQVKVIQCNIRDITERKRFEEAQVELERMKTQFISNVSHELRTPLQSIKGFTKLMLQGKVPDPETQKEFLTIIDSQSGNLSGLIESLLDMSRIESCRFETNVAPVSLRDLIHSVVHEFYSLAECKNIEITEDMAAALPEIEADEKRLRQVMVNLLGNAIKFSKDGGKVTVKAEAEDGKVLVQITDCGIGIPKASMEHLFEKFYQGDGSMTRSHGGSGLGLYISKQIIEAHGGRIWAESKPGKETTVFFIIPRISERGRKKLGEIMVEDGLITEQQLAEALKKQESQK